MQKDKGSITVQFAIVLPILVFAVLAAFQVGRIVNIGREVEFVADEAARYLAVFLPMAESREEQVDIFERVEDMILAELMPLVDLNGGWLEVEFFVVRDGYEEPIDISNPALVWEDAVLVRVCLEIFLVDVVWSEGNISTELFPYKVCRSAIGLVSPPPQIEILATISARDTGTSCIADVSWYLPGSNSAFPSLVRIMADNRVVYEEPPNSLGGSRSFRITGSVRVCVQALDEYARVLDEKCSTVGC